MIDVSVLIGDDIGGGGRGRNPPLYVLTVQNNARVNMPNTNMSLAHSNIYVYLCIVVV